MVLSTLILDIHGEFRSYFRGLLSIYNPARKEDLQPRQDQDDLQNQIISK